MLHALITCLHLAFAVFAMAALLAWSARLGRPLLRRAIPVCGLGLLFLFNGRLLWKALELRWVAHFDRAPWLAALLLVVLQVLAAIVLVRRARAEPGAVCWPASALAFGTISALALDLCAFWCLDLEARLFASDLRFEAGTIVYREIPSGLPDAQNAASVYARIQPGVEAPGEKLSVWSEAIDGRRELDTKDPALRAALSEFAPLLAEVRAAAVLEQCEFPITVDEPAATLMPGILDWMMVSRALALEARVRASEGDLDGALADAIAGVRFARQIAQTPSLVSLSCAVVQRATVVHTLPWLLCDPSLRAQHLSRLDPQLARLLHEPLAALGPRALRMEEAYALNLVGCMALRRSPFDEGSPTPFVILEDALYRVFLLEADVRGYRDIMHAQQALAAAPLADLFAAEEQRAAFLEQVQRSGMLASVLVPSVTDRMIQFHRADAEARLAVIAIECARHKLDGGRYPTGAADMAGLELEVRLQGDGQFVTLANTAAGFREPPSLRLPPVVPDSKDDGPR